MANHIKIKNLTLVGAKGDSGDTAENDTTVPVNGMMIYEGDTAPEGYVLVEE